MAEDAYEHELNRINREFYGQSPHLYFKRRLYGLAMMVGRPDLVAASLSDGLSAGDVKLYNSAWDPDDDEQAGYLAVESEVLLYQAAETLLRLLIAHYPLEPSSTPVLNLAALTSHREFYARVRSHFIDSTDEQLEHLVERTIHGFISPDHMPAIDHPEFTPEAAQKGKTNLRWLLRHLANFVVEDDHRFLNNSAKHGLAVRTGEHGLSLGTPDDMIIDQHGDALTCLAILRDDAQQRIVEQVIVWSNPARSIALVNFIIDVMEVVWSIAKNRVLGEQGVMIKLFHTYAIEDILAASRESGPRKGQGLPFLEIPHMRWPLPIALD